MMSSPPIVAFILALLLLGFLAGFCIAAYNACTHMEEGAVYQVTLSNGQVATGTVWLNSNVNPTPTSVIVSAEGTRFTVDSSLVKSIVRVSP